MPVLTGRRGHLAIVGAPPPPPVEPLALDDVEPGAPAWTATHPEFGDVTHVLDACPDLLRSTARRAHPWDPASPANGWPCTECLDLDP